MSKVTSKLQVTLPKAIAKQYGIKPGDEIDWVPAGDFIRVMRASPKPSLSNPGLRLRLFDQATERQRQRQKNPPVEPAPEDRGWKREELYRRGGTD